LAIATSGWANFWKPGEADFFSIAVRTKVGDNFVTLSERFTVNKTLGAELQRGRREITRELGVAVTISLVSQLFESLFPEKIEGIQTIRKRLDELTESFKESPNT
jgi:hypothetical protein